MRKRFKYIAMQQVKREGAFGYYLTNPVSDKTRTLIISERISFLRQQAKLSQRDVCEIIGLAVTTYSGYEQGKHEPSLETICRLASLYSISADFILGVGFHDPYSDDITEHYLQCKDYNDLDMENLQESMVEVAIEQQQIETDLAGYDLPDDLIDSGDRDESGVSAE